MDAELHQVREEIRLADEALVRELAALGGPAGGWLDRAEKIPGFRDRIELGVKVAESKFRRHPERYRLLARARDEKGLETAITDARMEEAVLERVRQEALACGADDPVAGRIVALYRDRIIPETKIVQIRRLQQME
ncbi:MAG: hypothetical protein R6X19_09200 [Kiritimatiellia bacterium]